MIYNIIICCTPLQIIIAEHIINLRKNEKFLVFIIAPEKNTKYFFYYKKLHTKNIEDVIYFEKRKKYYCTKLINIIINTIRLILTYLKNNKNRGIIRDVYMASINSLDIKILLKYIKFKNIKTFDDGFANLYPYSSFYYEAIYKTYLLNLCGFFSLDKIKFLSKVHYTIYENQSNIIDNTQYIDIIINNNYKKEHRNDNILNCDDLATSIFIGQPLFDLVPLSDYENLVSSTLKKYDINYYFPHPRENNLSYIQINNPKINIINTKLIIEDFFKNYLDNNKVYNIYTFFSGSALSLLHLNNVNIFFIKPSNRMIDDKIYNTILELCKNNSNVKVITF